MLRRATFVFCILAAVLLLAPAAEAGCIKRHSVRVASGTSPSGSHWAVDGSIGKNGDNCHEWLFGMDFEIRGGISWGSGTGIPAGGHIGRGANEPNAFDTLLEDGSDRVFAGYVNGDVDKVLLTLSNNKHLTIRPKSPPHRLLRKVVWLRNVRYIVDFYRPEAFVTGIATFSASGQLLFRDKSWEGF